MAIVYRLQRNGQDVGVYNSPPQTVENLPLGVPTSFRVRGEDTETGAVSRWSNGVVFQQPFQDIVVSEASKTSSTASIAWTNPDNLTEFRLLKDGEIVGTSSVTNATFDMLTESTQYTFGVQGNDGQGNWSGVSTINVTTDEASVDPEPPELPPLNAPREFGAQAMMSGASWTRDFLPEYYDGIVSDLSGEPIIETIVSGPGGNWTNRWENDATYDVRPREILSTGDPVVDIFAITDISFMNPSQSVVEHGRLWLELGDAAGTDVYFYALHGRNSYNGTDNEGFLDWYNDNENRISNWNAVCDSVNNTRNPASRFARLIPVGSIYKRIYEEILAENSPVDFREMYIFFGGANSAILGDPHPSRYGYYIIALAHYATVYRRSPVGAPKLSEISGSSDIWSDSTYQWLQELVWDVVQYDTRSGVRAYQNLQDWIISTTLDELVVYKSPDDTATNHRIRVEGDENEVNYTTITGPLPKIFSNLSEGFYEIEETGVGNWSDPVYVEGAVNTPITIEQAVSFRRFGDPLTSSGPNAAFAQTGDGIDMYIAENTPDGDYIIFVGAISNSHGRNLMDGTRGPQSYLNPEIVAAGGIIEGGPPASWFAHGVCEGFKTPDVPTLFSNIGRNGDAGGICFVLRGCETAQVQPLFNPEILMDAIDLQPVDNVPEGSLVINLVTIGAQSREIIEMDDTVTYRNGVLGTTPRNLSLYISTEIARGGTLPSRTASLFGAPVPMRSQRIIIPPSPQD